MSSNDREEEISIREGISPILVVRTPNGLEFFRSSQQEVGCRFHYSLYLTDLMEDFVNRSCGLSTMSISQYESRGVR